MKNKNTAHLRSDSNRWTLHKYLSINENEKNRREIFLQRTKEQVDRPVISKEQQVETVKLFREINAFLNLLCKNEVKPKNLDTHVSPG